MANKSNKNSKPRWLQILSTVVTLIVLGVILWSRLKGGDTPAESVPVETVPVEAAQSTEEQPTEKATQVFVIEVPTWETNPPTERETWEPDPHEVIPTEPPTQAPTQPAPTQPRQTQPAVQPTQAPTQAPTEAPTQAPTKAYIEYHFRSTKLLREHFEKHGNSDGMHFANMYDYERAASDVINNPNALYKTEKEDGDGVYYIVATNEFVVLSTDGYIRTYFLPSRGKAYFDAQ